MTQQEKLKEIMDLIEKCDGLPSDQIMATLLLHIASSLAIIIADSISGRTKEVDNGH